MQPLKRRLKRRSLAVILASLMVGGHVLGAGATPAPGLTLTQLLEQASACGPAFRELARTQEKQLIADRREQNAKMPAWRVSLGARLNPTSSAGGVTTLDWQLTDDLSVDLSLPIGTPSTGGSMGPSRSSLSVNWSKVIFPGDDGSLRGQIKGLEQHIADLDLREQQFAAWTDVANAFYNLRSAQERLDIAERSQVLAQGRADDALARFERGLIGLRDLQTEQNTLHQANASVHRAMLDVEQAWERLSVLLGSAACGEVMDPRAQLVDDIDWEAIARDVTDMAQLSSVPDGVAAPFDLPIDAWEEALLAWSATYQRAALSVMNAELALAAAESALGPSVTAGATVSSDLQQIEPSWSVGVNLVWDLGPNRQVDVKNAELDFEAAYDRLSQARRSAVDAVRTAWRAVTDAMGSLDRAEEALDEALRTQGLVERRIEAGLAPVVESVEAQLEVDRRTSEVRDARAQLNLAWLTFAHRLGIDMRLP